MLQASQKDGRVGRAPHWPIMYLDKILGVVLDLAARAELGAASTSTSTRLMVGPGGMRKREISTHYWPNDTRPDKLNYTRPQDEVDCVSRWQADVLHNVCSIYIRGIYKLA